MAKRSNAAPSVFGSIPGVALDAEFGGRDEVKAAGLHRHLQAGISGNPDEGADAIVVSGGYRDDEDHGDWILYTGQGGQDGNKVQVRDQELTSGNLGLVNSELSGLPVRVIRGFEGDSQYSPSRGYRYDGLFTVARHFVQASFDGPLIYRFELVRAPDADGAMWSVPASPAPPPKGTAEPDRVSVTTQRIVRNSAVAEWVKRHYDYQCQFCATRLDTPVGPYAEGAHIRPLGGVHRGRDEPSNILCLCANCHVLFDKGELFVSDAGHVISQSSSESRPLNLRNGHSIDLEAAKYHFERIANGVYKRTEG